MPTPLSTWMIIGLIALLIPAWYLFILAVVRFAGRIGGWMQLAELYPSEGQLEGERFRFRSLGMRRAVNYSGMVEYTVTDLGLRIRIAKPFSFGHRPLLLPWNEMTVKQGSFVMMNMIVIKMAKAPQVPLRIRFGTAMQLKKAAGDDWPSDAL